MKASRRVLARYVADRLVAGDDREVILRSLAAYIAEHRLQGEVRLILADISRNLAAHGRVTATVTTARVLDDSLQKDVLTYVRRVEDAQEVDLNLVIDPTLLGGVIIETPTKLYDSSVRTRLKRLHAA